MHGELGNRGKSGSPCGQILSVHHSRLLFSVHPHSPPREVRPSLQGKTKASSSPSSCDRHVKGLPPGDNPGTGCDWPTLGHGPIFERITVAREMASPLMRRRVGLCEDWRVGSARFPRRERGVINRSGERNERGADKTQQLQQVPTIAPRKIPLLQSQSPGHQGGCFHSNSVKNPPESSTCHRISLVTYSLLILNLGSISVTASVRAFDLFPGLF